MKTRIALLLSLALAAELVRAVPEIKLNAAEEVWNIRAPTPVSWCREEPPKALDLSIATFAPKSRGRGVVMAEVVAVNALACRREFTLTLMDISRDFALEPNGRAHFLMPIPAHTYQYSKLVERTGGRRIENSLALHYSHPYRDSNRKFLLISSAFQAEPVARTFRQGESASLTPKQKARAHSPRQNSYRVGILARPPREWPADPRCYSPYDAVILSETDWQELGPATREALELYRLSGGFLLRTSAGPDGGLPATLDPRKLHADLSDASKTLYDSEQTSFKTSMANEYFPIGSITTIPITTLLVILTVFAVGCVPFCVWRMVRRGRRLQLLGVLPAAAVGFTLVIVAIALGVYGVTPSIRVQSVTDLDQTTGLAATTGHCAIYSPVSLDGKLHLPADSGILPVPGRDMGTVRIGADLTLDGNDWAQPLTFSLIGVSRQRRLRERLDVVRAADGTVTVSNLLGAKVLSGCLTLDGRLYRFNDLAAGAKQTLKPKEGKASTLNLRLHDKTWAEKVRQFDTAVPAEGRYFALLEGDPFIPPPLGVLKVKGSSNAIVRGLFGSGK